jgi:hypothetical protein
MAAGDTTFGATSLFTTGVSSIGAGIGSIFAGQAQQYTAQQLGFSAAASQEQAAAARTAASADLLQGQGDILEGQMYTTAAAFAQENVGFTEQSTAIQAAQAQRQLYMTLGTSRATAAGAGGTGGGSAADILRSSASQGALNTAVLKQQGLITAAGYQEQATAYTAQAGAANIAAEAQQEGATGEEATAQAYEDTAQGYLAAQQAANETSTGDTITGVIQSIAGLASLSGLIPKPA